MTADSPGAMRQVRDDMPDLRGTRHTLPSSDGLSNRADRHRACSVIKRAIDARDVALLDMDPLEESADLIQCQGGREAARQVHMDFIGAPRRIGAQFAHPAQTVHPHPRQGIASEAAFGLTPIAA